MSQNFGQTTTQGGSDTLNPNQVLVTPFTTPQNVGALVSMSVYWNSVGTGGSVKYVLYDASYNFLAASTGTAITGTGWLTLSISYALLPSTVYNLGIITNGGTEAFDKGSTGTSYYQNSNNYTSPTNMSPTTLSGYLPTIYATYTPSATIIGYDSSTGGTFATTISHTFSDNTNTYLLVGLHGDLTDTLTGITAGGTSMTFIGKIRYPSDRWVYLYGIAGKTGTVSIVVSGVTNAWTFADGYTGVKQSNTPDSSSTGNSTTGTATAFTSAASVAANCWGVTYTYGASGTTTAGSGTTLRGTNLDGSQFSDSNAQIGAAGSSWTCNQNVTSSSTFYGTIITLAPFTTSVANGNFLTFM